MPPPDEHVLAGLVLAGAAAVLVGWLWLVVRAFRTTLGWGAGVLLLPPLAGPLFVARHWRRAAAPAAVVLVGLLVGGGTIAANRLIEPSREAVTRTTGGVTTGTLTGATATDAAAYLQAHRGAAVLQLADRADVTDDTLKLLADFPDLRELDLNGTPVTDAGLAFLATLPKLDTLRIARTKVTPDGVARHVLGNPRLRQIDVSGLGVPAPALRAWKNAGPATRRYVN